VSGTTLALTIDTPVLGESLSWNALESCMVDMSHQVPARALALVLEDAQERLIEAVCGRRWTPVPGEGVPFACPGCGTREGFVRKGKRTRPRKLRTAAGTVELIVWHVGCPGCRKVFSPLLVMLGLSGKRRTDRLSLDLAELGTQMSFTRSAAVDRQLAGTGATAGQAHNAMADVAALLTGAGRAATDDASLDPGDDQPKDHSDGDGPEDGPCGGAGGGGTPDAASSSADASVAGHSLPATCDAAEHLECQSPRIPVLGPAVTRPTVVLLDGTGGRAGDKTNGVPINLAIGLTGRSGPRRRRRAHTHLLGLTVGEDWSMMGAQLQEVAAPALVVVDGESVITVLAQRLWPDTPIQRCWWHLPHGLRKAFYVDDAHNRHVNPNWARTMAHELAELLREQIRHEHTTTQALADWDTFTAKIPTALTSAHTYLDAARPHAFTCLDPAVRRALAHLGGPELATGVIERLMREINARTDIGGARWSIAGLRDLLTVLTARTLRHPAWTETRRNTHPTNTIQFRLQKFNAT
jgi:hypothetical protein